MIPTSDAFKEVTKTTHTGISKLELCFNDAVIRTLYPHDGSVDTDRNAAVVRTFDCRIHNVDLTPQGGRDLLSPINGTIVKIYRGCRIPHIERAYDLDDTQAQFAAGTRTDTSAADDGSLVLGYI